MYGCPFGHDSTLDGLFAPIDQHAHVKILEAMAMGKAIVSTEAGIHGLELERGADVVVTDSAEAMAAAITRLLQAPGERATIEAHARDTAERVYGWDAIAREQKKLYESLLQFSGPHL